MPRNPQLGQWAFRIITTAAPFLVPVLIELQSQVGARSLDWWTLGHLAIGAAISLFVAVFHVQRAATERAEAQAEVRTDRDQDADALVEQPEPPTQ